MRNLPLGPHVLLAVATFLTICLITAQVCKLAREPVGKDVLEDCLLRGAPACEKVYGPLLPRCEADAGDAESCFWAATIERRRSSCQDQQLAVRHFSRACRLGLAGGCDETMLALYAQFEVCPSWGTGSAEPERQERNPEQWPMLPSGPVKR